MSEVIEVKAEELDAIMEQSTVRAERILRLEDELAKLREGQEPVAVMHSDGSVMSKADCGIVFDACCRTQTPLYAAPQPAALKPATKRQYYYRMDNCPASEPTDENCICWHDEGAGPIVPLDPVLCGWREVPVTKAVVMPERKELSIYADEEFHRWLEQLPDKAARLNRSNTNEQ